MGASGFGNGVTENGIEAADGLSFCFVGTGTSMTPFGCASKNGFVPMDGTYAKTADVESFVVVIGPKMESIKFLAAYKRK